MIVKEWPWLGNFDCHRETGQHEWGGFASQLVINDLYH
jgi:hypothetical protein